MLGFDVRTARATWTVALVVLALYATYSIRRTLFVFVLAVFFSYMLAPLVRRLRQHAPKRLSHTASTAIIFGLLILAIAALLAVVVPPIVDQAARLSEQLPQLVHAQPAQGPLVDRHALEDVFAPDVAALLGGPDQHPAPVDAFLLFGRAFAPRAQSVEGLAVTIVDLNAGKPIPGSYKLGSDGTFVWCGPGLAPGKTVKIEARERGAVVGAMTTQLGAITLARLDVTPRNP